MFYDPEKNFRYFPDPMTYPYVTEWWFLGLLGLLAWLAWNYEWPTVAAFMYFLALFVGFEVGGLLFGHGPAWIPWSWIGVHSVEHAGGALSLVALFFAFLLMHHEQGRAVPIGDGFKVNREGDLVPPRPPFFD